MRAWAPGSRTQRRLHEVATAADADNRIIG